MDQSSGHLSDSQIEQYGVPVAGEQPASGHAVDNNQASQIETHLADCPACRERLLKSQRTRLGLLMDPPVNIPRYADGPGPTPDCPGKDALRNLAAGLSSAEEASRLTQHAAQCDHCGPLLRMYAEDFSDDLTADEQAILGNLKSSSAGWQMKLAKRIMAESGTAEAKSSTPTKRKPFLWRWVMAPGAAAAVAMIVFSVWYSQRETPEKVEKLLAQAYTEQRTMEMRIPGAAWAPLKVTRGPQDSGISQPESLLQAERIIRRKQNSRTLNVDWVNVQAESSTMLAQREAEILLQIAVLDHQLKDHPESIPLMMNLSIACVREAQMHHDRSYYVRAIVLLTRVAEKDANKDETNEVSVFNLALTYGYAEMWDQAAATWERYLQLYPDDSWVEEARQRLAAADSKLHTELPDR